uniref:Peptidase, M48 family n=1 Tax=uncultured bacterium contig00043 TaxID=1181530 RepID=A0A806K079_9BACT|nr:peptidase, M48 family [uncultured bacterium contig00043]
MKINTMKKKIILLTLIAVIACGALVSCGFVSAAAQVAGATGIIDKNTANAITASSQAIGSAAEEITPEQEYYIGRAVAANILSSYKVWKSNSALTTYLNNICAAITINSPRPDIYNGYKVAILDSNEINAFATPGGHILVTRGLINTAKSEDALAGVIAHEVAHIQLQHAVKAIKTSRITQALIVTGTSAVGAAAGMDVNELTSVFNESVGEIVQTMVNSGYSQTQEFDADNTAMSLMASAGYNPQGLLEMLRSLGTGGGSGFGKTHPTPEQRIKNAEKSVGKYNVANNSSFRQARFGAAVK